MTDNLTTRSDKLAIALYQSISDTHQDREYEHWHASSIAACPRAQHYQRLGIKPLILPTAAKMLRWDAGHQMEASIRPHLANVYPGLKSNVRLTSKKMDLTGEYDNYSEKDKLLIEVKTVGPRAPRYRRKDEERHHLRDDSPYLAHEYQNHAYVLLLREKGLPIEAITYIYITLEGLIITYDTLVQENILHNVEKRLEVLKKAQEGALPACLCNPDHPLWGSAMQFCDYRDDDNECCSEDLLIKFQQGDK